MKMFAEVIGYTKDRYYFEGCKCGLLRFEKSSAAAGLYCLDFPPAD